MTQVIPSALVGMMKASAECQRWIKLLFTFSFIDTISSSERKGKLRAIDLLKKNTVKLATISLSH